MFWKVTRPEIDPSTDLVPFCLLKYGLASHTQYTLSLEKGPVLYFILIAESASFVLARFTRKKEMFSQLTSVQNSNISNSNFQKQ